MKSKNLNQRMIRKVRQLGKSFLRRSKAPSRAVQLALKGPALPDCTALDGALAGFCPILR